MSKYIHRDYDGDMLKFTPGNNSVLITVYRLSEDNYLEDASASVDVPRRKAVEVAKELLKAAGVDAVIANGDDLR